MVKFKVGDKVNVTGDSKRWFSQRYNNLEVKEYAKYGDYIVWTKDKGNTYFVPERDMEFAKDPNDSDYGGTTTVSSGGGRITAATVIPSGMSFSVSVSSVGSVAKDLQDPNDSVGGCDDASRR